MTYNIIDKIRGTLYGQAIGDALGLGSEGMTKAEVIRYYPEGFSKYSQMVSDSHRKMWEPGEWTDDTDMMLCILNSYDDGKFDVDKIVSNFLNWFNDNPRGIGCHTYNVFSQEDYLDQPLVCSKYEWLLSECSSAPNGALMRTSTVALAKNYLAIQTEDICRLTHFDSRCVGSCVIVTEIIYNLIWANKLLSYDEIIAIGRRYDDRIEDWVQRSYVNSAISSLYLDDPHSWGYTLRTLSAALWGFWHAPSFESGLLAIVNEGGDADTNVAVACSILGAKFGYSTIPDYFHNNLKRRDLYESIVAEFINKLEIEQ